MKTSTKIMIAAGAVALLQSAALFTMIEKRASILRGGKTVVLQTEPVDPRDLMRGDFVRLGYDISTLQRQDIKPVGQTLAGGTYVYVAVKPDGKGRFILSRADVAPIADLAADEVMLRGKLVFSSGVDGFENVSVEYGIERYYVPEGEGLVIEQAQGEHRIDAVLAVAENGAAQIRALNDGGKPLYKEPLY